MWVNFKVTDSNNNIVFESGRINADGSIEEADNDVNQTVFEPHYNLITSADQVQIYETIMGDSNANITYTLLRGAQYLKDNRLTPKGFDKLNVANVAPDAAVHGLAVNDDDFNLGSDEVTYHITLPPDSAGNLNVSVSLNYQTISHGFLQDLYRDNQLEQVQTFETMYEAQSLKYEQVSGAQTTVVSDGGGTPPPAVQDVTVSLSATPQTIDQGQPTTLSWDSTNATSCAASGAWSGDLSTTVGSIAVSPDVTSTYIITCNGEGDSTSSDSVTVTVNEPAPVIEQPTVNLTASPSSVARGGTITLSWSSTNANSCMASDNWSGPKATSGSESIVINSSVTFTLTCSNDGGSASGSVSYRTRGRRWLELR